MMRSGRQVYQPTTTTINDDGKTWMPSFLAPNAAGSVWCRIAVLTLSVVFMLMGLIMVIVGATSYNSLDNSHPEDGAATAYVTILVVGILLEFASLVALFLYLRHVGYYVPCCPGKIAQIRRHLHESHRVSNGAQATSGPLSAHYCSPPHLAVTPPPPPYTDISEKERLMEDKHELSDDTDRIMEEDPRIVLTPLKSHEEC